MASLYSVATMTSEVIDLLQARGEHRVNAMKEKTA